jgi:hypothetical protein
LSGYFGVRNWFPFLVALGAIGFARSPIHRSSKAIWFVIRRLSFIARCLSGPRIMKNTMGVNPIIVLLSLINV